MRSLRSILWVLAVSVSLVATAGCKQPTPKPEPVAPVVQDDTARNALQACEKDKKALEDEMQRMMKELAAKDGEIARWRNEAAQHQETSSKLQKELEEFVSRTPGTQSLQDGVLFTEALLFDSGRADLKAGGKAALDKLADILKNKNAYLRVEGHTDSDPIQKSGSLWHTKDNFELGAYRALSVTIYLKSMGVPPAKMYLASYGEHKPIAGNDTKENKAKNRRVEIHIFDKG